uniref:Si:ch211-243a20.3 n=1 Tax=Oncorhynchus mykiss TaxID=8022 RepID=A0A8C7QPN1_ONCMY
MAPQTVMLLLLAAMATMAQSVGEENELDYGYWNYREGAESVNVTTVRSVTRVLDLWGKRIFNEIKTLLHSQPSTLLPDYSRVRPLSESLNDLFREVTLLHRRITELTHRLATLEPFLRRHGYRDEGEEGGGGGSRALAPRSMRGGAARLTRYTLKKAVPVRGTRVVRKRRVRVYNNGQVRMLESASER